MIRRHNLFYKESELILSLFLFPGGKGEYKIIARSCGALTERKDVS